MFSSRVQIASEQTASSPIRVNREREIMFSRTISPLSRGCINFTTIFLFFLFHTHAGFRLVEISSRQREPLFNFARLINPASRVIERLLGRICRCTLTYVSVEYMKYLKVSPKVYFVFHNTNRYIKKSCQIHIYQFNSRNPTLILVYIVVSYFELLRGNQR